MIIRPPETPYQVEILRILQERPDFQVVKKGFDKQLGKEVEKPIYSDGQKSIVYDFAGRYIPKYVQLNWEELDLDKYVTIVAQMLQKHPNTLTLPLISCCINSLGMGYKTRAEDGKIIFSD